MDYKIITKNQEFGANEDQIMILLLKFNGRGKSEKGNQKALREFDKLDNEGFLKIPNRNIIIQKLES